MAAFPPVPPLSAPTHAVLALALLAIVIAALQRLRRVDHDPREPPLTPTRIPVFGHVIGLYRHGKRYYRMLEEKYGYDIYTLALAGVKQYVTTSPALTAAVGRQSKAISFRPFIIDFTENAMLFDAEADRINRLNLFDEDATGVITASHDVFYRMLPAGPALDEISQALLNGVATTFNSLSLVGALPNSTFTTFWFLARLLADRALVAAAARLEGTTTAVVDVRALRSRCPLTASAFRETLRLAMPASSVRAVRRDVLLDGRHLLRAGATEGVEAEGGVGGRELGVSCLRGWGFFFF